MTNGSLSALWDFYGEAFRLHSHQLLAWAHSDVRSRLHPDLDEPSITGLLASAMKERIHNHPETPDVYWHYRVGDQVPVSPDGQLGNKRLRLDITLVKSVGRQEIVFIFEAKRLKTPGFAIGEYVGAGGMGDFISGRYAAECPETAMVALFQNKDSNYWQGELERVFRKDAESIASALNTVSGPDEVTILDAFPDELQSRHRRANGTELLLFHIFLDCN